jgi:NAD(P)-dependent dehydrogenase (short-subunit alcohol dehydrogenase family)
MSDEGAAVVLCDLDQDRVDAAAGVLHGPSMAVAADVRDEERMTEAVDRTVERFGSIDVMFNNAGIALFTPIETITQAEFERVMGINVSWRR